MRIKIFETEIYVSFLFFAVLTFMLLTDRTGLILPTFFAVTVHEMGHLFAMWVMDCAPKSIRLIPASVQIVRRFSPKPHGESAVAICGPLCNIAVFISFGMHYLVFKGNGVLNFALLNLIIGVFNLLPVRGLDGGTLLQLALAEHLGEYRAEKTVKVITLLMAVIILSVGMVLAIGGKLNISVFIVAVYLVVTALIKR